MSKNTATFSVLLALLVAMPAILLVPTTAAVTFGNVGTQVATGNSDFKPTLYPITGYLARVEKGTTGPTDDNWYLYLRGTATSTVEPNSVRIVQSAGYGSFVTSGASDDPDGWTAPDGSSSVLTTNFASRIRWLETDGNPGFSKDDAVYIDMPDITGCSGSSGVLSLCDIRLNTVSVNGVSYTAGTMVTSSNQADLAEATDGDGTAPTSTTFGTGSFVLKYFDANGNFVPDSGDAVYVVPESSVAGTPTQTAGFILPMLGDVRIAPFSGTSAGTRVQKNEVDTVPTLQTVAALDCIAVSFDGAAASATSDHKYFLHNDADCSGAPTTIANGDLVLAWSGVSAGTVVSSASNGEGKTIDLKARFAENVFALDLDSNGVYSTGDGVYFNRPLAWAHGGSATLAINAGDIRLSHPSLTQGQVVASGASDLSTGAGVLSLTFNFKYFDTDRRTSVIFDTNDQAYLGPVAIATASIPQLADVRLIGSLGQKLLTSSTGEWIPTLIVPTQSEFEAIRLDLASPGSYIDDLTYINTASATTTVGTGAVRLVGYDNSKLSGSQASTGDFDHANTGILDSCPGSNGFVDCVGFINAAGGSNFELNDILYFDSHAAFGVGTQGFGTQDIRLNSYSVSAGSFSGGSMALGGHADVTAYQSSAAPVQPPCLDPRLKFWDDNLDGVFNVGDTMYLSFDPDGTNSDCPTPSAPSRIPRLLDVRLSGPGGSVLSTTSGSSGGGGTVTHFPALHSGAVSPPFGVTGSNHVFTVTYSHGGGFSPSTAQVVYSGAIFDMTTSCTSYSAGCSYSRTLSTGGVGAVPFYFNFAQGGSVVRFPSSGNLFLYLASSSNEFPTLASGGVTPSTGNQTTDFQFFVTYTDLNNDAPTNAKVMIDGTDYAMTSSDTTYYDGAIFTYTTKLAPGEHTFAFKFRDAANDVYLPSGALSFGPNVTRAPSPTDGTPPTDGGTTSPAPTPGIGVVAVAALLAIGAALVGRRKRIQ